MKLAYFVTSHGMGHATRACAVMQALHLQSPGVAFEIFTDAPAWIFEQSLGALFSIPYRLHTLRADIGLVQRTPFEEDLPETLRQLDQLLPYSEDLVTQAANALRAAGCRMVFCDIAPLGILAAERARIPSILIENFRWDWIYAGYLDLMPQLQRHLDYLGELFRKATFHIQTEPVCDPVPWAAITTPPISRMVCNSRQTVRLRIGIPADRKVVLVTSGASPNPDFFAAATMNKAELFFVFPDQVHRLTSTPNGVRLPRQFYHPDLVNASDAVVGKAGYSTLAEAYHAGALLAYISRARFRESMVLGKYIQQKMGGFEIPDEWQELNWLTELQARLRQHTPYQRAENGALQVARFVFTLL